MKIILTSALFFITLNFQAQKCKECQKLYDNKQYEDVIQKIAGSEDSIGTEDLVLLAKSYQNLGMKKDAIGAYSHILLNDENNLDALVSVSALFIEMEQYDNALFAAEKALLKDKNNEFANYNKAVVLYYKDDEKAFYTFVNEVISKNPKNMDLLFVKAMKQLETQDFKTASETFIQIEKNAKAFPNLNFYSAYAHYKLNQLEEAKTKFKKAIDLKEEQIIDAYYYLAQIYKQENKKVEACDAYTSAINLGDITLTKEADAYCKAKKPKKIKLLDRGFRPSF